MGLFDKKTPMQKWRRQNPAAARFVDAHGWNVDLETGVVHTVMSGRTVVAMMNSFSTTGVIVEAGAQAERTLRNEIGDDGGESFRLGPWSGAAAPGSGLVERSTKDRLDDAFFDDIVAAAEDLVARIG